MVPPLNGLIDYWIHVCVFGGGGGGGGAGVRGSGRGWSGALTSYTAPTSQPL